MKITFLGATHQVTGSKTLIEWKTNRFFLVDCGMEQGINTLVQYDIPVPASSIEYVLLTHAHIDHSGLLPLLVKNGFKGKIYSTAETMNLCSIMLSDSASIQESDAATQSKKNLRAGLPVVEPLYTAADVQNTMKLFRPCNYNTCIQIDEGLTVRFTDAGHLLGSSYIECFIEDNGISRKFVFSGDVGNLNQPIIRDPGVIDSADFLMIESTYGTRYHDTTVDPVPKLSKVLSETFERGGTVVIPAFAVGRTQELLYFFRRIKGEKLIDSKWLDFPVYVDSPLANEATAVFLQCNTECLDDNAQAIMRSGENPIWFDGLNTVVSSEESKALNTNSEPKVIIASGGMCEGGRIRHHLKHHLWNAADTVLFTGYQAAGTLGRIIYDGARHVKLFGEEIEVRAQICLLEGVSGHGDRGVLLRLIDSFNDKPGTVFVNHGDDEVCEAFANDISEKYQIQAFAPYSGSVYDLEKKEWIRLTGPEYRAGKSTENNKDRKGKDDKHKKLYNDLLNSVRELEEYVVSLNEHSNSELKKLTEKIRSIYS